MVPGKPGRLVVHRTDVQRGVPCRVIAKLQDGLWRVIVGLGVGHLDGGIEQDLAEEALPADLRWPNATFFVTMDD